MAAEIFHLLGKFSVDGVDETQKQIDGVNDKAGKVANTFGKLGTAAVQVGKVVAAGLAVGATAVTALVKTSIDSYAEYEQLVGGAQLMFGDAYDFVADKAANAYKNVQMSQNDYLKQVNGFATGLKKHLNNDAKAAAELADKIVTAEADIVAATGASQEAVQNAFNGIMKSNFTMLDNLQIGITPTKEGFEDLIDTVNDWNEANGKATDYQIDNLADCQAALVDYIEMQGMAGYAADEAAGTIQGSLAMTKASWSDLMTSLASDSGDVEEAINNFVESAVLLIGNIGERVQLILPRIVEGLQLLLEELTPHLSELLELLLPGLIEGATTLIVGLVEALPTILQILIEQIPEILVQIGTALIEAFPALLETIKGLIGQIWEYIGEELFGVETDFETTFSEVERIFNETWAELEELWETTGRPIFNAIQECIDTIRDAFAERMPEISETVTTFSDDMVELWEEHLKPCLEAIATFVEEVLAPVFEFSFNEIIMPVVDKVFSKIVELWETQLQPQLQGIIDFLTGVFSLDWEKAWEGIKSIFEGVFGGLGGIFKPIINDIISGINSFIRGINRIRIPDWVPGVGGRGFNIREIPLLAKGGVLEEGQVGLLEGSGAEAVVPLEKNREWINKVAKDMDFAIGGSGASDKLQELIDALSSFGEDLFEMLADYFADALESRDVVLDSGELVGALAVPMNERLGRLLARKERGR